MSTIIRPIAVLVVANGDAVVASRQCIDLYALGG